MRSSQSSNEWAYLAIWPLLDAHHHGVGSDEVLHAGRREPGLRHPPAAVGARVVEAAGRLDQHVEAHEEPVHVLTPLVVDERLVGL